MAIRYHVARGTLTLAIHALLIIGFWAGIYITDTKTITGATISSLVGLAMMSSLIPAGVMLATSAVWWSRGAYSLHPIARTLNGYHELGWRLVASAIEMEFRRVDKGTYTVGESRTVYVTQSWIIQPTTYSMNIAHQRDVDMSIVSSHTVAILNSVERAQILVIKVSNNHQNSAPFSESWHDYYHRSLTHVPLSLIHI